MENSSFGVRLRDWLKTVVAPSSDIWTAFVDLFGSLLTAWRNALVLLFVVCASVIWVLWHVLIEWWLTRFQFIRKFYGGKWWGGRGVLFRGAWFPVRPGTPSLGEDGALWGITEEEWPDPVPAQIVARLVARLDAAELERDTLRAQQLSSSSAGVDAPSDSA